MKKSHKTNHPAAGKMLTAKCVLLMTLLFVPFGQFVSYAHSADSKEVVQDKVKISGFVFDKNGEPIIGATILEKGTTNGAATNEEGRFSLDVAGPESVLAISFIGYLPVEQKVGTTTSFRITMVEDEQMLDEVVVIGYGTQRKADVTSSVASVKSADFLAGNIQDAGELVKGKIAGLTITKGSGDPNAESTIRLRGFNSLTGANTPLVLIDGIEGSLGTVAPENIESIDVLKDASAAAIYGTRGASGVIIITTKTGKRQESTNVTYSAYGTMSDYYKLADFMDGHDVRFGKTTFKDYGWDTDWIDAVSQLGYTQNHSLTLTGGSEKTSYSASVSYRDERGIIRKSNSNELRMSYDISHWMLDDVVKLNFNMVKGIHKNDVTNASSGGVNNIYRQAIIRNPTEPVYIDGDKHQGYFEDFTVFQYYNPVSMIYENIGENKSESTRLTGNLTLEPIKGWQTNLKLSTIRYNGNTESYTTKKYYTTTTNGTNGQAYKGSSYSESNQLELTSNYQNIINGVHRISALAGYSYQDDMYESMSASNYDFPTDAYLYNNLSMGAALKDGKAGVGSSKTASRLIGFFGRISYGYQDKYNILASIRHEGSSKFGANYQWGNFPAVSAGWTISKEDFMSNFTWLSNLKLRAGYGITGIIAADSYNSITLWNYDTSSWGYFLNSSGEWVPSLIAESNTNPDLKWETSGEFSAGLEFGILNERITGTIEYYDKLSKDLLYWYTVPSPPNLFNSTFANAGKLRNRGIDLMIKAVAIRTSDFEYTTTLVASHNSHKVLSLSNEMYVTDNYVDTGYAGDPVSLPTQRLTEGSHFGKYMTLITKGVSPDGKWMVQNPATGKYEEFTAAMATSESPYRQWTGTSGLPKVYLSWNNAFRWKNFDMNIQMSSQLGYQIVNEQRMFYENNSIAYNRLKTAADPLPVIDENGKPTGETAKLSTAQSQTIVSWYYEDGDFLKVDYLTLGYTFNTSNIRNVNNFRVYVSGENLLCLTKYKGLDPELSNGDPWSIGVDGRDKYPTIRSFTIGASINFK